MGTVSLAQSLADLDARLEELAAQFDLEPDDEGWEDCDATSHLGDERQLRGIPALSRGVGGAIAGTNPGRGGVFR